MTTGMECMKSGVTGQTYREIIEKFGNNINRISEQDEVSANYAIAFAWFREREHLPVQAAYEKSMSLTITQIEALFEEPTPEVQAAVDFVSPPSTTMQN